MRAEDIEARVSSLEKLAVTHDTLLQQVHHDVKEIKNMITMLTTDMQFLDAYAQNVDHRMTRVRDEMSNHFTKAGQGLSDRIGALEQLAREAREAPQPQQYPEPQASPQARQPMYGPKCAPPPPPHFHYGSPGTPASPVQENGGQNEFQTRAEPRVNSAFQNGNQPFQHAFVTPNESRGAHEVKDGMNGFKIHRKDCDFKK